MCQMKCCHISIQKTHHLANLANNGYSVFYAWNLEKIVNIANTVCNKK